MVCSYHVKRNRLHILQSCQALKWAVRSRESIRSERSLLVIGLLTDIALSETSPREFAWSIFTVLYWCTKLTLCAQTPTMATMMGQRPIVHYESILIICPSMQFATRVDVFMIHLEHSVMWYDSKRDSFYPLDTCALRLFRATYIKPYIYSAAFPLMDSA